MSEQCECTCGKKWCASNRGGAPERRRQRQAIWERENGHARSARQQRENQVATSATASRAGAEWTSAELDLVARPDLTRVQVAQMTGRTFQAVKTKRSRIKHEPKLQRVIEFKGREGKL